jgi:hypothetical protein
MRDEGFALARCSTREQPPNLYGSPVIDDWQFPGAREAVVAGEEFHATGFVSGSPKYANGFRIATAAVVAIDSDLRWVKCADGDLYWLGVKHEPDALIVRAAYMDATTLAYRCLDHETGRHTLSGKMLELLNDVTIAVTTGPPAMIREEAAVFADAMLAAGRAEVADGWRLLATDPADRNACSEIRMLLLAGLVGDRSLAVQVMLDGWTMMAEGKTFGVNLVDVIKAAHKIGKLCGEEKIHKFDLHNGGEETIIDEVRVEIRDEPTDGVVVLKAVGGMAKSYSGKEITAEFNDLIGKRLPLKPVPDLAATRKTLLAEFPYAERVIDILLADLIGREDVRIRATLILGSPGCGKTRLIRKVGSALDCQVGRYDGASAEDNCFGGTARRWTTGEPCWPMTVIRAAGHANPIIHVDEIDKGAENNRNGSLARALLPMLETETAARFPDPFIQTDIDLSHVSFLLTANDDTTLPLPLKDRLRILRMPPITIEHVPAVAAGIVVDLAAERGLDCRWVEPLNGDEIEIAQRMLGEGSARRLRAIVERLLAGRESGAMRH